MNIFSSPNVMLSLLTALIVSPYSSDFTLHRETDPSTGKVACRYFLPSGWNVRDSVSWTLENKGHPVSVSSDMSSPDGKTSISILPSETMQFAVQNGKLTGTLPPETASNALDNVLAASHPGLTNATLVVRRDFDVPTPLDGQGLKTKGIVGILEVSFQQNGRQMTELLSVTEYEGSQQGDGGAVQGVWMMLFGYTLTCAGPISEDAFKTFAVVAASHRPDPTFFSVLAAVNKGLQTGPVDLKSVSAGVTGLDGDVKTNYIQNIQFHGQSIAKMFPIFPGETEVDTYEGSLMSFKGLHVWMKKPNAYQVTDSATGPGAGWEPAKDGG